MDRMEHKEDKLFVEISPDPLNFTVYTDWVGDPGAGAIATFAGTTRNNFNGKTVERLEYEAYVPMALKNLHEICVEALKRWDLIKIAVVHRVGVVPVGEASVLIAASSAHRRDALEACQWTIDELKATVPIWKKEFFEGGEVWKENAESRARLLAQSTQQ